MLDTQLCYCVAPDIISLGELNSQEQKLLKRFKERWKNMSAEERTEFRQRMTERRKEWKEMSVQQRSELKQKRIELRRRWKTILLRNEVLHVNKYTNVEILFVH